MGVMCKGDLELDAQQQQWIILPNSVTNPKVESSAGLLHRWVIIGSSSYATTSNEFYSGPRYNSLKR